MVYRMETLSTKVPKDLLERVEGYREEHELNRSQAIRRLLEDGLEYEERPQGVVITKPAIVALIGWWLISVAWLTPEVDTIGPLGVATVAAAFVYALLRKRM